MKKKLLLLLVFVSVITVNGQIVINEINYKDEVGFDTKDWVELYNNSGTTVNISNWVFKDDDDLHEFIIPNGTNMPPNSYLVLVQTLADFQAFFPAVSPVLGDFTFGFSGGGELIRLFNNNGVLMDSVEYDDIAPWPIEPDGTGPTLELTNPNLDNALASSWKASTPTSTSHGTPGAVNSTFVLGIEDNTTFEFSLYPNPLTTKATLSLPQNTTTVSVLIYDVLGRETKTLKTNTTQLIIEKGNLKAGIYLLKIVSDNGSVLGFQKLIVR